jgi:hypothetical protein
LPFGMPVEIPLHAFRLGYGEMCSRAR